MPPCGVCRELMVQLIPGDYRKNIRIIPDDKAGRVVTFGELTPRLVDLKVPLWGLTEMSVYVTICVTSLAPPAEADIRPFYENQLKWCGVDYFDFYLVHAQSKDIFAHFKECRAYETAPEFKKEGKIRTSAFSSATPRMCRRRFLPSIRRSRLWRFSSTTSITRALPCSPANA